MSDKQSRRSFLAKSGVAGLAGLGLVSGFGSELQAAVVNSPVQSRPSDLQITEIKAGYIRNGHSLFVKIFTNQDIYGCGEAVDATPGTYHLVQMFGRRIKGKNPLNVHRIFEDVRRGGFFEGAQAGMYIAVLSAIETALWDLSGKALGVPVYQLLGGKFRDKIRVYCDTAAYRDRNPTPEQFGAAAKDVVDRGFTAVKLDIDQAHDPNKYDFYNWTASPAEMERMYNQIAAVREAVGPHIDICVDMHGRYDVPTGQRVAKMMEPLNLMFLEEPIPAENVEALKIISDSTTLTICVGENLYLAHGFRKLLEIGAADMIMPDLQKCGGLGEGQRIANLANLYYVPFSPHMVGSYLAAMASSHVCASVPNFAIMEWQLYFHTDPMFKEIVTFNGEMIEDGHIVLREEPGIGVDINVEGMRKYATEGMPFFV